MFFKVGSTTNGAGIPLPLRCPSCRREGSFEVLGTDIVTGQTWLGQRRCPNQACHTHVFVAWRTPQEVIVSYPAQRIDFDASHIPAAVVAPFEEALTCEAARCFVAAGMLVRKTLEQLCADRGASGKDLHKRIESLKTKVILPEALFVAAQDLRLLGNDAAHIESKTYNDIGQQEVGAAIALTKEILKAVYQYGALLEQLRALKK